jgi:hypothetical protein
MTYCITSWGNAYDNALQPLMILQKKIVRRLSNIYDDSTHSSDLFLNLKILKLNDIYKLHTSLYIHKMINNQSPDIICQIILSHQNNRNRETRLPTNILSKPQYTLACSTKAICFDGVNLYNNLPDFIKESTSYTVFKKNLRLCLILTY